MEANPFSSPARRRGVIKRDQVRVDGSEPVPASAESPAAPLSSHPAPRVRLVRLDEHAQAIEFTCACGEVSLIEIDVGNTGETKSETKSETT